jgi:hypothetical protein
MIERKSGRRGFVVAKNRTKNERNSIMARAFFANWHFTAQKWFMLLAVIASAMATLSEVAPAQSQG